MKFLLDTHLLLWIAGEPERLSKEARVLFEDMGNQFFFSVVSLWEIAIKRSLRGGIIADPRRLRRGLVDNDFIELAITGEHVLFVEHLAPLHKDPFDRLLVAQATCEGITLLTVDTQVLRYGDPVRAV